MGLSGSIGESGEGDNEQLGDEADESYHGWCVVAVPEEWKERC